MIMPRHGNTGIRDPSATKPFALPARHNPGVGIIPQIKPIPKTGHQQLMPSQPRFLKQSRYLSLAQSITGLHFPGIVCPIRVILSSGVTSPRSSRLRSCLCSTISRPSARSITIVMLASA